MRGGKIRWDL